MDTVSPHDHAGLFEVLREVIDVQAAAGRPVGGHGEEDVGEVSHRFDGCSPVQAVGLTAQALTGLVRRSTAHNRAVEVTANVLRAVRTVARPGHAATGVVGVDGHLRTELRPAQAGTLCEKRARPSAVVSMSLCNDAFMMVCSFL